MHRGAMRLRRVIQGIGRRGVGMRDVRDGAWAPDDDGDAIITRRKETHQSRAGLATWIHVDMANCGQASTRK